MARLSGDPGPNASGAAERPWWGLGDVALGFGVAIVASALVGAAILGAGDYDPGAPTGVGAYIGRVATQVAQDSPVSAPGLPLSLTALLQVPLWVGLLGVPLWASVTKGHGLRADFRVEGRWPDVPIGLAVGVAAQLLLVPLVYLPLRPLIDVDKIDDAARALTDRAIGPLDITLLVLIVVIGAPIVEELFYRGLVFHSLDRRAGRTAAIVASSVLFGLSHLQLLQLPALIMFGLVAALLVHRFDRLAPAVFAHVGFNLTTVVILLAS